MASNAIPHPDPISPTPSKPAPDGPMREIKALCDKHTVACGTPVSLAQFMHALNADKLLAMEFWSLVARLSNNGRSSAPDWLLAAVVEAVTGQPLAEVQTAGPSQRLLVGKLTSMLAGEDENAPQESGEFAFPSIDAAEDSPRKHVPDRAPAPPEPAPAADRTARPRLVLKPETPMAAALDRSQQDRSQEDHEPARPHREVEPTIAIPLAAYAEENGRPVSRPVIGALLLIALVATGLAILRFASPSTWQRLGDTAREQFASVTAAFHRPAATPAPSANPDQSSFVLTPPANAAEPQSGAAPATPPSPQPATAAAQTPEPAAPQRTESAAVRTTPPPTHDAAPPEAEPHADAQVVVPAALMRNYLISSRIPIYPQGASGTVVILAIVTARGTVEPVHVISGEPELREAALAAVASWHYRPYMLNGTPVDVSTTISVNDTGND